MPDDKMTDRTVAVSVLCITCEVWQKLKLPGRGSTEVLHLLSMCRNNLISRSPDTRHMEAPNVPSNHHKYTSNNETITWTKRTFSGGQDGAGQ